MKQQYALSHLRLFLVVMVVLHHAALAYNSYFNFTDIYLLAGVIPFSNLINPIVDTAKSPLANLTNGILDSFFMSTMFFISGIFVWGSLKRKGVTSFILTRAKRLGIPFILGVFILMPLAYYPANMQYAQLKGIEPVSLIEFWKRLASIGFLTGPFWFVLVLFGFNLILAAIYPLMNSLHLKASDKTPVLLKSSLVMAVVLIVLSLGAFIPMANIFGADQWLGKGILNFQTARLIPYFIYFIAGTWIGSIGIEKTAFGQKKFYGMGWLSWIVVSFLLFFVLISNPTLSLATFSVMSATFTIGLTGLFMTYFGKKGPLTLIAPYSYSIYILHYPISSFLQHALLKVELSGLMKALMVFILTTAISLAIGRMFDDGMRGVRSIISQSGPTKVSSQSLKQ